LNKTSAICELLVVCITYKLLKSDGFATYERQKMTMDKGNTWFLRLDGFANLLRTWRSL